jgi:DMSO/TMAO reductase YedYZ molybdopterin-dependent catalytic subunit
MAKLKQATFIFIAIFFFQSSGYSQNDDNAVFIDGQVKNSLTLSAKNISQFKKTEVKATDKDGEEHAFSGVLLADLLQSAGTTLGKDLRGKNLRKYVLVTARDGYQVVFSLGELDPELSSQNIALITQVDGKPLSDDEGPFRIVAPHDKKHARWVRQVKSIKVLTPVE